ncbi:ThuA domain-containing protein [Catenovulum sp. 2E275]|nr:ThuA domain-containing protein [Catenovulum sp. 2E275]MCU4676545.1 ThuA domain-containing protein [Catenovulum sp. 2E275]
MKKLTITISLFFAMFFCHAEQFNVLLFSKTAGWHHKSINQGVNGLETLAKQHFFKLDWHEDANRFNDEFLKQFDVIVFLNTTGDILNKDQQAAFQRFIQSGKGFVGIHSAADTEYDWPWYGKMIGHYFKIHPQIQTAQLNILNNQFPGMVAFNDKQLWTDEWYDFYPSKQTNLNYILAVDEQSYSPEASWGDIKTKGMGDFHPIAWYHNYDGGRAFYTALGHMPSVYSNEQFLRHLYGGIYWAATGKGIKSN